LNISHGLQAVDRPHLSKILQLRAAMLAVQASGTLATPYNCAKLSLCELLFLFFSRLAGAACHRFHARKKQMRMARKTNANIAKQ
jgi:hypothetical protein